MRVTELNDSVPSFSQPRYARILAQHRGQVVLVREEYPLGVAGATHVAVSAGEPRRVPFGYIGHSGLASSE
jgi:hypothetical protein